MEAKANTTAKPAESKTLKTVYERKQAARKAAWQDVEDHAEYREVVSASYDF